MELVKKLNANEIYIIQQNWNGRENTFSFDGIKKIIEYLEDALCDEIVEFDFIEWCCSFTEFEDYSQLADHFGYVLIENTSGEEFYLKDNIYYDEDEFLESLEENYTLLKVSDENYILVE